MTAYVRVAALRTADQFARHLEGLGVSLPFRALGPGEPDPLATPCLAGALTIGNRFAIQPMEGWDGTADGSPTDLTRRRWERFGQSGAKLIWGGEAVAVVPEGRANPNQLVIDDAHAGGLADLRRTLVRAHERAFGRTDDPLVGLQLTHSGRYARPHAGGRPEPVIAYRHPLLDRRLGLSADYPVLDDDGITRLVERFVAAAALARDAGFAFVDVKHCHGYLGHELLSARTRPGRYGGPFENRTRFLREVVEGIRARVPGLAIGVRDSIFDSLPFHPGADGMGEADDAPRPYPFAFGADADDPLASDLDEPTRLLALLESLDVRLVNLTAGSPYYNPHLQRPALFPPSDGYRPPEDPLVGVARQIAVTASLKRRFPRLVIVGSAYSYLQEWLPDVARGVVADGGADVIGLGRLALSYPNLPADVLAGRTLARALLCRTFSDCTTAPRRGLVSGCYPLDAFYRARPEAARLADAKAGRA
jgi:2,4-dienoyl-CoA reductase-like NADH-dependent reductase (Old Yellow Enzyme family)